MVQSEVVESLKEFISLEILDGKDIGLDGETPLLEWGIINSMETTRLVNFIQDRYGIIVPAEKIGYEYFKDLNSLSNLVSEAALGGAA